MSVGLDTRFPRDPNPGSLNAVFAYEPTTGSSFPYYSTDSLHLTGAKFVQNGERVAIYGFHAPSPALSFLMTERSGALVGDLSVLGPVDVLGWQDGLLYLTGGSGSPYSLNARNTRTDTGLPSSSIWTSTAGPAPMYFLQTPGNMQPGGPLAAWNRLTPPMVPTIAPTLPPAPVTSCPVPHLRIGGQGQVTPGEANNIRIGAGTGAVLGHIPPGGIFDVLDGPVCASTGILWWRARFGGIEGYTGEGQGSIYWALPIAPGPSSGSSGSGSSGGAGNVTSVKATVNPKALAVNCPATFTFTGQITVSGPATVTYRWERSDGAVGSTQSLTFGAAGSQNVTTTWTLGEVGTVFSGWEVVHVLSPNEVISEKVDAVFDLKCGSPAAASPFTVLGIKTGVDPNNYSDKCPATFTFYGDIIVQSSGTVTYRWERSDGAVGPTQSLGFGDSGSQTVSTTWTLGDVGMVFSGWEVVHVLSPNDMYSDKSAFNLSCAK